MKINPFPPDNTMWICHCNPFDDSAVKSCLEACNGGTARVSSVYKNCSGGKSPNCGSCIGHLREMVMEHNRTTTVENVVETMRRAMGPETAPVKPCHGDNVPA